MTDAWWLLPASRVPFGGGALRRYFPVSRPLASGLLTGKYRRDADAPKGTRLSYSAHHSDVMNDKNWARLDKLNAVAARTGHSLLELAFGWLLAKPVIGSVIAGATKPEQIEQNVAAAGKRPSPAIIAEIDAITA